MSKVGVRGALLALMMAGLVVVGCGGPGDKDKPKAEADKAKDAKVAKAGEKDKHEGWWCVEHGIPEEECSMCSAKVAKECKAKGDWCKEHDRALSQCFHCNPDRRKFYAAKHVAKTGKEPPPIEEFDEKKGKDKK